MANSPDNEKELFLLKRSLLLLSVAVCLQAVGLVVIVLLVSGR